MWSDCEQDLCAALTRVGTSGWYVLGQEVADFEADLAAYCDCATAVGCANGLDAIEIALRIAGIGQGDKVLTTPLSAFATALGILRAGAEPVYCDVDGHGLLDPSCVTDAFALHPDIRAVIPVHLYGHLADMPALASIAAAHDALVIEDAAQAIGAQRDGYGIGADGRMAALSFYPTKNLGAIGDGGALLIPDHLAETARALRNYGQTARYVHDVIGLNSRLDELHAAMLKDAFLPRLPDWLHVRRRIAHTYLNGINNPAVTLLPGPDPEGAGWHLFPVLVDPDTRESFMAHLAAHGIGAGQHYPVLMPHQKAVTTTMTPLVVGDLPSATRFATGEVSLPIHPYLTEAEQAHVIASVNTWSG